MTSINKEILQQSYWEHFKAAKDLALYLDPDHPRRITLEKEMSKILSKLELIKDKCGIK